MAVPKLHTSTELVVVRAGGSTVDQALARTLCGHELGGKGPANGSVQRPLGQSVGPGPGTSSATASILRPAVQHRPEWAHDLASTSPFVLPSTFIQEADAHSKSRPYQFVRYIADRYDVSWISHWATKYGDDSIPVCPAPPAPTTPVDGEWARQYAHLWLLETCFTTLEIAAYEAPEKPIESLPLQLPHGTLTREGSPGTLEAIRLYWIAKRRAAGTARPLIPALHVGVVHEYNSIGTQVSVLGDCPLPFKQREWSAPVVRRKAYKPSGASELSSSSVHAETKPVPPEEEGLRLPELSDAMALVDRAMRLSDAVRIRESLRHRHTQLALYELALLRHGERVAQTSESSWQRLRLLLKRTHDSDS